MAYIDYEDYLNKRIYLSSDTALAGSLDLIEVYREHIERRRLNVNGERGFFRMVLAIGNDSAGGEFTPRYVDLQDGVRLVPYNTSHAPLIRPTPLISRSENKAGRDLFDRSSLSSGVEVDIDYRPEISGFREVNVEGGGSTDLTPLLSELSIIKAQTNKLEFDASNRLASNVKSVNDTTVTGTGAENDPWGS